MTIDWGGIKCRSDEMQQYRHLDEHGVGNPEAVTAIRWTGENEDQLREFLKKTGQAERLVDIQKIDGAQVARLGYFIGGRMPLVMTMVYPDQYVIDHCPYGLQIKPAEEFESYYNAIVTAIAREHLTDTSRLDE